MTIYDRASRAVIGALAINGMAMLCVGVMKFTFELAKILGNLCGSTDVAFFCLSVALTAVVMFVVGAIGGGTRTIPPEKVKAEVDANE